MKLVLLSDLHYHEIDVLVTGLYEARSGFYRTLLQRFMDVEADLHISLGDLTNYGTTAELNEVYALLNRENRSFVHVLGNHDLYAQPRADVLAITGQRRYWSMETEEAFLVFLDTCKELSPDDWGGWLDDEQLQWLEEQVVRSGLKPLLVFGHHPVYATTTRSTRDRSSIDPSIAIWRILSRKNGVGVYFNGHTHVDSIAARDQWKFVQLASALDEPGFRIVDLDQQMIRVTAVDVTDGDVVDHAPLPHRYMQHFTPTLGARGHEEERSCIIPLLAAVEETPA